MAEFDLFFFPSLTPLVGFEFFFFFFFHRIFFSPIPHITTRNGVRSASLSQLFMRGQVSHPTLRSGGM